MSDPKLWFWYFALAWFLVSMASALAGWRAAVRGEIGRHRRWMQWVIYSVGIFVVAYVIKVALLGKEDLDPWSSAERTVLYVHESFILLMLLAGARARWLARGLPSGESPVRLAHRRMGRVALICGMGALLTALAVLVSLVRHRFTEVEVAAADLHSWSSLFQV